MLKPLLPAALLVLLATTPAWAGGGGGGGGGTRTVSVPAATILAVIQLGVLALAIRRRP